MLCEGASAAPFFQLPTGAYFVGTLGASNYIFAEATWTQRLPDWIASHERNHFPFVSAGNLKPVLRRWYLTLIPAADALRTRRFRVLLSSTFQPKKTIVVKCFGTRARCAVTIPVAERRLRILRTQLPFRLKVSHD